MKNTALKIGKFFLGKWFRFLILPLFLLSIVGFAVFMYFFVLKDIPKATQLGSTSQPQSSKIYDRNGELLYTMYTGRNQTYIPLSSIPKHLQQATIAIEDRNFYNHGAIDIQGIIRAVWVNLRNERVEGGSTLTQQLVKSSLLTPERTIERKAKEIILSFIVETIYPKNKILEMYLNQVAYGGTAYGVDAASQVYFNKPISQLTLAEAAFLAGLPQAPSRYSPFGSHPEEGKARQQRVLVAMFEEGYITEDQMSEAKKESLEFSAIRDEIKAPHFVFYVKDYLTQKYGAKVVEQGGLSITTTLDLKTQKIVEDAIATEGASLSEKNWYNAASVVTHPMTGEILAMAGSRDYFNSEREGNVNVAIANRQPGSSIKPINYATGLINGYTAATPFVDKRVCFSNPGQASYCPRNYDGSFHGVVQMREALANSYNIPAVKMLKLNTVESMIGVAERMGITSFKDNPDRYGLSLTLGGGEVTMLQMTEAFGVFANSGYRVPLQPILKIERSNGEVVEEYEKPTSILSGKKVVPEGVAFIISHILQDNAARTPAFGSNSPLRIPNYPVSVKTGTTNDYRDNWTIGYTPSFVASVWVGNNDNTPLRGVTSGITGAAPIWNDIMTALLEETAPEELKKPESVVGVNICSDSGLRPQPDGSPYRCPTKFEYFLKDSIPSQVDPGLTRIFVNKETNALAEEGQTENIEERDGKIVTDATGDSYCTTCAPPPSENPTPTP
jgi:1A family penicillin-binding protein